MSQLLTEILSRDNMKLALKRVKANKGAGGVDGVDIKEIDAYLVENWVEIPKPNGGVRNLGIPTVVDRVIEQAIAQRLTPIMEPYFSEYSYGFRPNRCAP